MSKLTEEEFTNLADKWEKETGFLSDLLKVIVNTNYLTIISKGYEALPFIYNRLKKRGGYWFAALRAITGENPTTEMEGNIIKMREAWLELLEKKYECK